MTAFPKIDVRIRERPGHGFRVRVMVLEDARVGFRAGQADYNSLDRIEQMIIPFWRTTAARLGYSFGLDFCR